MPARPAFPPNPPPAVSPSETVREQAGRAWCRAEKGNMDNEQEQDRHPLRWEIASIGMALWVIAAAIVYLVVEVTR